MCVFVIAAEGPNKCGNMFKTLWEKIGWPNHSTLQLDKTCNCGDSKRSTQVEGGGWMWIGVWFWRMKWPMGKLEDNSQHHSSLHAPLALLLPAQNILIQYIGGPYICGPYICGHIFVVYIFVAHIFAAHIFVVYIFVVNIFVVYIFVVHLFVAHTH